MSSKIVLGKADCTGIPTIFLHYEKNTKNKIIHRLCDLCHMHGNHFRKLQTVVKLHAGKGKNLPPFIKFRFLQCPCIRTGRPIFPDDCVGKEEIKKSSTMHTFISIAPPKKKNPQSTLTPPFDFVNRKATCLIDSTFCIKRTTIFFSVWVCVFVRLVLGPLWPLQFVVFGLVSCCAMTAPGGQTSPPPP